MAKVRDNSRKDPYYEILSVERKGSRMLELLKVSLPRVSNKDRNAILYKIMDERGSIGLIEPWTGGSIIHKPKFQFNVIAVRTSLRHSRRALCS